MTQCHQQTLSDEKAKNLSGSQRQEPHSESEPMPDKAPGWNQKLASSSEAGVKARPTICSLLHLSEYRHDATAFVCDPDPCLSTMAEWVLTSHRFRLIVTPRPRRTCSRRLPKPPRKIEVAHDSPSQHLVASTNSLINISNVHCTPVTPLLACSFVSCPINTACVSVMISPIWQGVKVLRWHSYCRVSPPQPFAS
jgi:hypothetical protein